MKKKNPSQSLSLSDLAKKIVYASLGSAALAKRAVSDSSLHRELLDSILSRAGRTKDDVMEILAAEVSKFLGKINVSDEITKSLQGLIINFNATIDFKDKKNGSPTVKIKSVNTKRR